MPSTGDFFDYRSKKGGEILSTNLENKQKLVDEIKDKVSKAKSVVFVSFLGTNVENDTKLRKDIRDANSEYKVYKNTLLLRALTELGFEGVEGYLHGTTSVAINYENETSVAKIVNEAKKYNDKLVVKFGILDGKVIDDKYVTELANIPSKEELYAKLAFLFKSPMQRLAIGLKAVADKN